MPFSSDFQPRKRCKGKLDRKRKCGDKNSKRKAASAAKAWQTFKNVSLVITDMTVSVEGNLCMKLGKEIKRKHDCISAEPEEKSTSPAPDMCEWCPISDAAKRQAIACCYYFYHDAEPKSMWAGEKGTIMSIIGSLQWLTKGDARMARG